MPQCSVPRCTKQGGHKFPMKNAKLLKQWLLAIKREQPGKKGRVWQPGKAARVCSEHFDDKDYKTTNYYGNKPGKKELKDDAVPHIFNFFGKRATQCTPSKRSLRAQHKEEVHREEEIKREMESRSACSVVAMELEVKEGQDLQHEEIPEVQQVRTTNSSAAQTDGLPGEQLYSAKEFDDDKIHFYTGLESYKKFLLVLDSLGPAAYNLNYYYGFEPTLTVEDQFLLTLIKLRTHPSNKELGFFFGLKGKQVSNIYITWINFMYCQWEEIEWWAPRELVRYFAPTDFRSKFPATRCIFDGTEFPIKKPKQPVAQQATFSTYKNRNTMKVLVGASPGGLVTYVSPAYGGSTSDRQIVERSKIPSMCDPGDEIMADKGFNVEDMFIPYQVSVNIPTFFKKKNRMSNDIVLKDRKIASKRVHIERIIGLAKTYAILRDPMQNTESSLASRIAKVVFTLCNFRNGIVPEDA